MICLGCVDDETGDAIVNPITADDGQRNIQLKNVQGHEKTAAHKAAAAAIAAAAASAAAAAQQPLSAGRAPRGKARDSSTSKRAMTEAAPAEAAAAASGGNSSSSSSSGGGGNKRRGGGAAAAAADEASDVDRQAAQNQKRGRWLASVTSVFTPSGGDGSSGTEQDGDEREGSARKRLCGAGTAKPEGEEYAVEKIVDVQRSPTDPTDVKYMIKWKGWPSKYNTWEPLAHLQNMQPEIEAFESSRAAGKA